MLVRRYFGFLLVASVFCFILLAFFDSKMWRSLLMNHPRKTLKRYSKAVEYFLSPTSGIFALKDDSLLQLSEDQLLDIQGRIQLLMSMNRTTYHATDVQTEEIEQEVGKCKPQENIVFLKTHKTGSSTLTNILNRFADLRELKVALPTVGFNRFRWPLQFHWTYVDMLLLGNQYANILCNHARYKRDSMDAIMELNTKYISILRNPVTQFESMFDYMEFGQMFGLHKTSNPLRRFLRKPFQYIRNMTRRTRSFPEPMHLIRNGQFFDLGLHPEKYDNRSLVLQEIYKLDREFSLVLIMEYFDESLVLLKRELCWEMEDIVYAKFNQRFRKKKEPLDDTLKHMIERWNGADVLLYRHFNKTFWEKIEKHGKDFYKDLEEFRAKNQQVQSSCISPITAKERAFRLTKEVTKLQINPKVSNFDRYFCEKLLTDEVNYLKYFRLKQHPYFGYQRRLKMESGQETNTMLPLSDHQRYYAQKSIQQNLPSVTPQLAGKREDPSSLNKPQFVRIRPRNPITIIDRSR